MVEGRTNSSSEPLEGALYSCAFVLVEPTTRPIAQVRSYLKAIPHTMTPRAETEFEASNAQSPRLDICIRMYPQRTLRTCSPMAAQSNPEFQHWTISKCSILRLYRTKVCFVGYLFEAHVQDPCRIPKSPEPRPSLMALFLGQLPAFHLRL